MKSRGQCPPFEKCGGPSPRCMWFMLADVRDIISIVIGPYGGVQNERNLISLFLYEKLWELGVNLKDEYVCSPNVDILAVEVKRLAPLHDFVIVSGGVYPNREVTMDGMYALPQCNSLSIHNFSPLHAQPLEEPFLKSLPLILICSSSSFRMTLITLPTNHIFTGRGLCYPKAQKSTTRP